MSTFALVHGAWQTAATWDLVAPGLRAGGHAVTIPLLSGLEGESSISPAVSLSQHIDDVLEALTRTDAAEVVLVGHSYAGMIITGVAEQAASRIKRLVYIDAFVPADGQSVMDLLPPTIAEMFREQARRLGGGWLLPSGEGQLDLWGLKPGPERDFVRARLSDFSLRCFEEKLRLHSDCAAKLPRTFIASVAEGYPARAVFQRFADRARNEGWSYHELPTGHDSHVERPEAVASILMTGESAVPASAV